jgi:hypothetical protein
MATPASRARIVAREFLALSESERVEFLEEIEHEEPADEFDAELREELEQRVQSVVDGTAFLLDGDEVMATLRSKFRV